MTRKETWAKLVALDVVRGKMPARNWSLKGANLKGANLYGANLKGANMFEANLTKANLEKANFEGASVLDANLVGANLKKADLTYANFSMADLTMADLTGAKLTGAGFVRVNLLEANLSKAVLGATIFIGAKLIRANLNNANIVNTNFNGADLSGADLTGAYFWGVSTTEWKIDGIKAKYIYFKYKSDDPEENEKYKRVFREGEFEELFKHLPTIEVVFEGGLEPKDLMIINALIEDLKNAKKNHGIDITGVFKRGGNTYLQITSKEEYLVETRSLVEGALKSAQKGIPLERLLPFIKKQLPYDGMADALLKEPHQNNITIVNNNYTIQDGGQITQALSYSGHAAIDMRGSVFNNYKDNSETIDIMLDAFKSTFKDMAAAQRDSTSELVNKLMSELRKGKDKGDEGKVRTLFNDITAAVGTVESAKNILSLIMGLLGGGPPPV